MTSRYDSIIVGSGISGATLAYELTKAEKKVLLIEKGKNHQFLGNHLAAFRIADRKGFRYTKEHLMVASGITVGGSSLLSAGTAFRPPRDFFKPWKIDLERELDEAEKDSGVIIPPDNLIGKGNLHLLEAGNRLDQEWIRFPKFIDVERCLPNCSACMLGCKRKAKFNARNMIELVKDQGLEIQKKRIDHVIIEGNKAVGVKPSRGHSIRSENVIICAGGIHSPIILQKSGIKEAGKTFFMDPMVFTYGVAADKTHRTIHDIPMGVGTYRFYNEEGILLSPVVDPWGLFLISFALQRNPTKIFKFRHYFRLMGIMAKTQDEKNGTLSFGRFGVSISKKLTDEDKKRLERGYELSKEVLIEAGSKEKYIFSSSIRGAHPGGSNGIGEVVNLNLATKIPNLYVCDSSILPRSLGTPLVLVLVAFAKRLANELISNY